MPLRRHGLKGVDFEPDACVQAQVKNGRLVLDEPTNLPEGREVEVVLLDDDFDPEEKARLLQAIEHGEEDFERGTTWTE